jgi:hypothetical protein
MTALIKLSPLFFVSLSALADDAEQVQAQSVVIQEQVEQAEKLEQDLAEILRVLAERKAEEDAATPPPTPAPPDSED